jgi:chromate transporter
LITVAFIGYLVAGSWGAVVAALATFLPCYLFTVIPAPYFKKYAKRKDIAAFVTGITAAATGAIAGAVVVLGRRSIVDAPTALVAVVSALLLLPKRRVPEPLIVACAATIGWLVHGR